MSIFAKKSWAKRPKSAVSRKGDDTAEGGFVLVDVIRRADGSASVLRANHQTYVSRVNAEQEQKRIAAGRSLRDDLPASLRRGPKLARIVGGELVIERPVRT